MSIDLQFKLKKNPLYIKFLRENSHWYKYLNRDPNYFKQFEVDLKNTYKLNPSDKISRAIDTFDIIQTLLSTIKK